MWQRGFSYNKDKKPFLRFNLGPAAGTKLTLAVSATNGGATTTFLTETTPFTFQDQKTKAPPPIVDDCKMQKIVS